MHCIYEIFKAINNYYFIRKKSEEARFDEIRAFIEEPIITAFKGNCSSWLMDNKMCLFIIAVVDRFGGTV